jgi:large subunit ribosomal protein L20
MPRARKGAARTQARRKLLREARGYYGTKSRLKQQAKVAIMRALRNMWRHRRLRRRNYRQLWITRITAACRMRGFKYSLMINGLSRAGCLLNRKMLSEIAIHDPATVDTLVTTARPHFPTGTRSTPMHASAMCMQSCATWPSASSVITRNSSARSCSHALVKTPLMTSDDL